MSKNIQNQSVLAGSSINVSSTTNTLYSWLNNGRNTFYTAGNVAINKSSIPNYNLDVNGSLNATTIYLNGSPVSAGSGSQWTTNASTIYYNGGNVGINNSTPLYKLDIGGALNCTSGIYLNGSLMNSSQWATNGSSIYYNIGNIGINRTNPSYNLDISGNCNATNYYKNGTILNPAIINADVSFNNLSIGNKLYMPTLPMVRAYTNGSVLSDPNERPVPYNTLDTSFNNIGFTAGINNSLLSTIYAGTFTCPIAGYYRVKATNYIQDGNPSNYTKILNTYLNGTLIRSVGTVLPYRTSQETDTVFNLIVGDKIYFTYLYTGTGFNSTSDSTNNELIIYYLRSS